MLGISNLKLVINLVSEVYFHRYQKFENACWACAVFPIVCIDSFATNFAVKRCVIFQAFNKNSLKEMFAFSKILILQTMD